MLIAPYVPGLSECLKSMSGCFGVRHWQSYGGKLSDLVSNFKDHIHSSKSLCSVYSVACGCGVHYVGESRRNLKIRIQEHRQHSSKSAISLHVWESEKEESTEQKHEVRGESMTIITQEKNARRRHFIESICMLDFFLVAEFAFGDGLMLTGPEPIFSLIICQTALLVLLLMRLACNQLLLKLSTILTGHCILFKVFAFRTGSVL